MKQPSYFTKKNYIDLCAVEFSIFLQYPRKEIAFQNRKEYTITVEINKNLMLKDLFQVDLKLTSVR